MHSVICSLVVFALSVFCTLSQIADAKNQPDPPNILVILVDDLGFSDLGCYGSEINTPNLDKLADGGLRFTQMYNTGRCWPTRSSLMTGYYPHQINRDALPGVGGGARGKRPNWAPLITNYLKKAGYRNYHSGKWHIDGMPIQNGFDNSYYLADQGRFFNPQRHFKDDKSLKAVEKNSGFYGTTAIANHTIECLKDHAKNHSKKPFFQYLAFTAPHFPLHALPEDIKKYQGKYDIGWQATREARWARIAKQGLIDAKLSKVQRKLGPPYHFPDALKTLGSGEVNRPVAWADLTQEQKKFQSQKMELHAAMIDRIDQEIGRVVSQLETMKAKKNTVIFFLSDNGASAEIMVRSDGHDPKASFGSAESYLCLGPGWSTTCNTPFRKHKTWVHEGGIATPMVVSWPARIAKSELRTTPAHVIDLAPTIMELAGADGPEDVAAPSWPGKSLVPAFDKDKKIDRDFLWWSHEGHNAIRIDDWKLVRSKGESWELYNLASDRAETNDLASQKVEKLQELKKRWLSVQNEFRAIVKANKPNRNSNKKKNQQKRKKQNSQNPAAVK